MGTQARPRDTQVKRLYAAEIHAMEATGWLPWKQQTIQNDDLQAWADRVLAMPEIQSRWHVVSIRVQLKRGGNALAHCDEKRITLPKWARNEWVILHELAHILAPREAAHHGPEYAGILVFLISHVLGVEARKELLVGYENEEVRWNTGSIPKPFRKLVGLSKLQDSWLLTHDLITQEDAAQAANTLRRAAKQGLFGEYPTKQRKYAFQLAQLLGKEASRR